VAPALNPYGFQIAEALLPGDPRPLEANRFAEGLPAALAAVAALDADLDAWTNEDEIAAGADPANADDAPAAGPCRDGDPTDGYEVCSYDPVYAFRRIAYDFCGRAPERDAARAVAEAVARGEDVTPTLRAALATCLDSEAWIGRDGRVWRLANTRIRPLAAISSNPNESDGAIPLADYLQDYAFFVWTQTDGRDARDLLLGDYFVEWNPGPPTTYTRYEVGDPLQELLPVVLAGEVDPGAFGAAQFVEPERRAGMITHRWFLMSNTMFTAVPRTTAAQAYRAYLGFDIAKLEGLHPAATPLVDYDSKGVTAPNCAVCHTTLDPLTYPFTRYNGIGGGDDGLASGGLLDSLCGEDGEPPSSPLDLFGSFSLPFSYDADRMESFTGTDGALVAETPEAGLLFGQPVSDLRQWATVAVAHPAFAENLVRMWWEDLLGASPRGDQQATFQRLVDDLRGRHGFSVEAMLHDLVLTEAYGAP
jgi:hypothetical protein